MFKPVFVIENVLVVLYNCVTTQSMIMAASTSYSSTNTSIFRKRSNPPGSDDDGPHFKASRDSEYYYVLQPESEPPTDEDPESIYSVQDKPTDSAKDTSDLSYSDDSNIVYTIGGDAGHTISPAEEYEPASLSEQEFVLPDVLSSASDSEHTQIVQTVGCELVKSLATNDEDTWADSSSSECEPEIDPELSLRDYWSCIQCKATNNNPLFRYCEKCFKVEYIAVGEDCALLDNVDETISTVGRRGLVGQLFIFKIAGAMSNNGASLSSMLDTCKNVLANMATLGVCTSPCTLPGATQPLFKLDPNHYELGLGNHGEAGVAKINICSADELVKAMLEKIIKTLSVKSGDEVCIIVNNLGASSQMESFIVAGECSKQLKNAGIAVARLYVGTLVTSLDMGGVQISLLKTTGQPNWLKLLDAETEAFAWPGRVTSYEKCPVKITETVTLLKKLTGPELPPHEADVLKNCLQAIAYSLKSSETKLNLLDSGCGDGDCGTTLRNLADGILKSLNSLPVNKPQSCFLELAQIASETMGGTSGGIYSLMLRGASRNVPDWTAAWKEALETVKKYSPAREGCRTMMDALIPAYNTYEKQIHSESWQTALASAVKKAEEGCESTRNMEAKCGRASYVNKTYLKDVDAGAFGVTIWLQALFKELCQK
ncbi:triokinase/FMN cyclase-like isoform X1 [Lycorma delicatula]|uniref:triokinase/FMN cyclase-like isoform X1 n=1 Tax=Lycorma delicatula TaxID=130591 RepID=UPI003F512071